LDIADTVYDLVAEASRCSFNPVDPASSQTFDVATSNFLLDAMYVVVLVLLLAPELILSLP
jgi:hypothetical protein